MIIKKHRIMNIENHIGYIQNGETFYIVLPISADKKQKLLTCGFSDELNEGEKVLPAPLFGPISRYNANGKSIIRRDLPMEVSYRQRERHRKEFHGRNETVDRSEIRDTPYKRYPRDFVPPASQELTIININGGKYVASELKEKLEGNYEDIRHTINLFLEIFGECETRNEDLSLYMKATVTRLNRKILPEGEKIREHLESALVPTLKLVKKGNRTVTRQRLDELKSYSPDKIFIGSGGFMGYLILGYSRKRLFLFESLLYGNATYVFTQDPVEMSQKTKKEIITGNLNKDRIIHLSGWSERIRQTLS